MIRDADIDSIALREFMPRLLWVLRDFTLQLRDVNNEEITAKQYMEAMLEESHKSKNSKSIAKSI